MPDILEILDIDPENDQTKCGWRQIKMIFKTLIDNSNISPEDQLTPTSAHNAIQFYIKEEEHFWHFRAGVMSDFLQQPNGKYML